MNRADGRFVSRPAPRLAAGALALGVHVLFVLLLVFGVSWQTRHPEPVTVDLLEALPHAAPRPPPPPAVPAAPAPAPAPERPPEAEVKKVPAPPKAPDIALEKKQAEADRAKEARAAEERARVEAAKAAALQKAAQEKAAQEKAAQEKVAQEKVAQEKVAAQKKRDLLRQMEEEDAMRRMAEEEAANQALRLKQAEATAAARSRQSEVARVVGQHRDLIRAKVRGNTRLPDNLTGNPEVRCLVKLLPTGEVQSVRVTRSSGNPAYDEAVKRAIEKSSPLPLPADRDARAEFVPELSFVHRPQE